MSDFYKRFLMEEGRRISPDTGRFIALAAFGKHPGWADHIEGENLGLETESLSLAKTLIYNQGVRYNIDAGTWEKLPEENRLAAFNHTFVWQRADQFLIGRMWPSRDRVGRDRYPMIVCAHCIGVPLRWALDNVLPRLVNVEQACQATQSESQVRSILDRARMELRGAIGGAPAENGRGMLEPARRSRFVGDPAFGPDKEGWFRIIYWLETQAGAFGSGEFSLRGDLSSLRAQQVRVPAGESSPDQCFLLWSDFFYRQADRLVPTLLVCPAGEGWLDVTLGEPAAREFFFLRASRGATHLATEVPYNLDQAFRDRAKQTLADFESGRPAEVKTRASDQGGSGEGSSSFVSVTQRWFRKLSGKTGLILFGFVLVGLAVALAIPLLRSGRLPGGDKMSQAPASAENQRAPPVQPSAESETIAQKARQDQARRDREEAEAREKQRAAAEASQREQERAARMKADADAENAKKLAAAEAARIAVAQRSEPPASAVPDKSANTSSPPANSAASTPPPVAIAVASSPADTKAVSVQPATPRQDFTNAAGMAMVWVAGVPGKSPGAWVGKFEVTQREFTQVMGSNPSRFQGDWRPVESISRAAAAEFCRRLTDRERTAGTLPDGFAYALPTQAQWTFYLGDAAFQDAVTSMNAAAIETNTLAVGSRRPNEFGLYDVLGNVWEWCSDGDSPDSGVLKGGAYNNRKVFDRKLFQRTDSWVRSPDEASSDAGFRCVLVQSGA